jgi:hypothetical protein
VSAASSEAMTAPLVLAESTRTSPPPFVTYIRLVQETKQVAEVTAENVTQIAALIGGMVDYFDSEPVLVCPLVRGGIAPWRVKMGTVVGLVAGAPPGLINLRSFNCDNDWVPEPVNPGAQQVSISTQQGRIRVPAHSQEEVKRMLDDAFPFGSSSPQWAAAVAADRTRSEVVRQNYPTAISIAAAARASAASAGRTKQRDVERVHLEGDAQ